MNYITKYFREIIIFLLSIIICGFEFFFKYGTYFLVDGVFYPIDTFRNNFFDVSIFWFIIDFLTIIFGYIIFSKLFYFLIVFFSGILGLKFFNLINNYILKNKDNNYFLGLIGAFFLMINPFFYERMLTQPGIFLSILLLGYGIYFFIKYLFIKNESNLIIGGIFFGLTITISQHTIFIIMLFYFLYLTFFIRTKKDFLKLFYSGLIILLLNLNWLIGSFLFGSSQISDKVGGFNQANIDNFLSNGLDGFSTEITNLLLYGFWGERYNYFSLPGVINERWYIGGIFILLIIFIGIVKLFFKNKKITISFFILGFLSLILGLGISSNIFGGLSDFLYKNIPFYIGLREPQKWIGVLMLSYLIFFNVGVIFLYNRLEKIFVNFNQKILKVIFILSVFLFLNAWCPGVLFGFNNQLYISNYPESYFDFKEKFNDIGGKTLVLPWHSYIGCDFTKGKVIANISGDFFRPMNLVIGDNLEVGNLYSNSTSEQSKDIEEFLISKEFYLLKKYDFTNILFLDKCGDYANYNFLKNNQNLELEYDSNSLKFYKIIYE